jgi:hypothetical protein
MKPSSTCISPQIVVVWNIVHDLCIAHSSISGGGSGGGSI